MGATGQVGLCANLRQSFGGRIIEWSFVARLPRQAEATELVVNSAAERPAVGVIPAAGGRVRPIPGSRFDPASLVGAVLELEDPKTGETVTRRPRRVVPLRRDEMVGHWSRPPGSSADDVALLVKDDDKLLRGSLASSTSAESVAPRFAASQVMTRRRFQDCPPAGSSSTKCSSTPSRRTSSTSTYMRWYHSPRPS